jgi:serine/threonine protein phosphatase PrpC
MEDSHIAALDIEPDVSLFGVFDGHGGCEVALFVENHFVEELKKTEAYRKGDYKNALIETFLQMDRMLLTDAGKKELALISKKHSSGGISGAGSDLPF